MAIPKPCPIPLAVADIVGQHGTLVCRGDTTLSDAADFMMWCDRTAAVVVDVRGDIQGAITENDFVRAYFEGTPWDYPIELWLKSGSARLPTYQIAAMTVPPNIALAEAAEHMRAHAVGEFSSRHLLVRDENDALYGILSCLDLARAMCATGPEPDISQRLRGKTVAHAMKSRGSLPTCAQSTTMTEACRTLIRARQNCLFVAENSSENAELVGVITPRDVLRAFSQRVPGSIPAWKWLNGPRNSLWPRMVKADVMLTEAAATMAANSLHHLVVVKSTAAGHVVGVLSSSDLAQAICSTDKTVAKL